MKDKCGNVQSGRQQIADIFADFYEELYDASAKPVVPESCRDEVLPFTKDEIQQEINKLKTGKSKDRAGVCAEMLKSAGDNLIDALL
eukprot:3633304-Karenia_brevis.AAC.1